MTTEQLEARLNKLITYTKQLVERHNALEKRVEELEAEKRGFKVVTSGLGDE